MVFDVQCASIESSNERLLTEAKTDARYFSDFRSMPLIRLEENKVVPVDISFILDKCHMGVQWALHVRTLAFQRNAGWPADRLSSASRVADHKRGSLRRSSD